MPVARLTRPPQRFESGHYIANEILLGTINSLIGETMLKCTFDTNNTVESLIVDSRRLLGPRSIGQAYVINCRTLGLPKPHHWKSLSFGEQVVVNGS